MNMILIKKFSTRCANCQRHFWFFKTHKGIKFCPKCNNSLIIPENQDKPLLREFEIDMGLFLIFPFLLISLQPKESAIKEMLGLYLGPFIEIGLGLLILIIIKTVMLPKLILFKGKFVSGADNYQDVLGDAASYIKNKSDNKIYQNKVLCCHHCMSQRLQKILWHDKHGVIKLAENNQITKPAKKSFYIKCLNCGTYYQKSEVWSGFQRDLGFYLGVAVTVLVFNMDIILADLLWVQEALSNNEKYALLALLGTIAYWLITMHANYLDRKDLNSFERILPIDNLNSANYTAS